MLDEVSGNGELQFPDSRICVVHVKCNSTNNLVHEITKQECEKKSIALH